MVTSLRLPSPFAFFLSTCTWKVAACLCQLTDERGRGGGGGRGVTQCQRQQKFVGFSFTFSCCMWCIVHRENDKRVLTLLILCHSSPPPRKKSARTNATKISPILNRIFSKNGEFRFPHGENKAVIFCTRVYGMAKGQNEIYPTYLPAAKMNRPRSG